MNSTVKTSGRFSKSRGLRASVPFFLPPPPLGPFFLSSHFWRGPKEKKKKKKRVARFRSVRTGSPATQAMSKVNQIIRILCPLRH